MESHPLVDDIPLVSFLRFFAIDNIREYMEHVQNKHGTYLNFADVLLPDQTNYYIKTLSLYPSKSSEVPANDGRGDRQRQCREDPDSSCDHCADGQKLSGVP